MSDIDGSFRYSHIIRIIQGQSANILIAPNPVKDELTLKVPEGLNNNAHLQLTDATGKIILVQKINQAEFTVTRKKNWAAGTYMARIIDKNGNTLHSQKLLFW